MYFFSGGGIPTGVTAAISGPECMLRKRVVDRLSDGGKPFGTSYHLSLIRFQRTRALKKNQEEMKISDEQAKEMKARCLSDIRGSLDEYAGRLSDVDERLKEYVEDCVREDIDAVNLYELLGVRKMLRMLDTYPMDVDKVRMVLRAYEGLWEENPDGRWTYVENSGGLLFSGMSGRTHYRLTPLQVMELAPVFGFMRSESDWRRVTTEANYFIPRKSSKTTLSAFYQFWFFMFEDQNAECYCCANSQDQSKILFDLTWNLIHQLDPNEKRIRFTATEVNWKPGQMREAKVAALSAGGKTKDGLFAQLCCADEFGSASYVKEKSDMANLVNVVRGSMGPRREPMTVITTTAGRIETGPYKDKLQGIMEDLLIEMSIVLDGKPHRRDSDWQFALICQPDQWETSDEDLQRPEVWRKVNRHIGVTVQPDYYENEWKQMRMDDEYRREQVTKLFNVWQSSRVKDWLSYEDIAKLQVGGMRIDDLNSEDGWVAFVGQDFSKGDDINAQSYLCYNQTTGQFFADMDAWISKENLEINPNSTLYKLWASKEWLRVCPGATIDENLPLNRLIELSEHLTILRIGYDPYDAKRFVNAMSAWIASSGEDPKQYIVPVRQGFAVYNPLVQEMEFMVKNDPPLIRFSENPMWPWEFGNCMLVESNDGYENCKPLKSGPNNKVDNVQALLSALWCFDVVDGQAN